LRGEKFTTFLPTWERRGAARTKLMLMANCWTLCRDHCFNSQPQHHPASLLCIWVTINFWSAASPLILPTHVLYCTYI
jgi:hypothetical protein